MENRLEIATRVFTSFVANPNIWGIVDHSKLMRETFVIADAFISMEIETRNKILPVGKSKENDVIENDVSEDVWTGWKNKEGYLWVPFSDIEVDEDGWEKIEIIEKKIKDIPKARKSPGPRKL